MRGAIASVALVGALILAVSVDTGCGFETRSQDFECTTNPDCESFQRCVDGVCVIGGSQCHPDCDRCDNGTCFMDCQGAGLCASRVVCPPSSTCRVVCSGAGACAGGVDCTNANRCLVSCQSAETCAGSIDCGQSDCTVGCLAQPSCEGGVDCSDACACNTNCTPGGGRTCVPECPQGNSCADGANCTSDGAGCDVCEG